MNKIGIFCYNEKNIVFDMIYIFNVAKQGFLGNFGTGTFFKRFYETDV